MGNRLVILGLALLAGMVPARAVLVSGVASPATGTAAENYVGSLNGASATYLGGGWVLTAAHVGAADGESFSLDGYSYTVTGTVYTFTTGSDTADLVMFQIAGVSSADTGFLSTLGSLTIGSVSTGDQIQMIGYGDDSSHTTKTSGTARVVETNQSVLLPASSFVSTDFYIQNPPTDSIYVTTGDSGGGAFLANSLTLTGILEVELSTDGNPVGSGAIELSAYQSQISAIMATTAVPEPGTGALLGTGGLVLLSLRFRARRA